MQNVKQEDVNTVCSRLPNFESLAWLDQIWTQIFSLIYRCSNHLAAYLSVQPQALKLQDTVLKNRETKHFITLLLNDEVLLLQCYSAEVESSRTSFVSRTHFEVLGLWRLSLGLEKCPVLGSRTTVFFELLKFCSSPEKNFEDLSFWRSPTFGL